MPLADLAMGAFLVLMVFQGMRHGISKTLISLFAVFGASWIAVNGYTLLGPMVASKLQVPADMGLALGAAAAWAIGYVVCLIVGWLLWRKIRGKPSQPVADDAGVVTKIAGKIPSRYGIVYFLDKSLGGALGLVRGALYLLIFLFIVADNDLGTIGKEARASSTFAYFTTTVRPQVEAVPGVKLVLQLGNMRRIAFAVKKDPSKLERVVNDPSLGQVRAYPPLQATASDPQVHALVREHRFADLLRNEKVLALLEDRQFLTLLSAVDFDRIAQDMNATDAPAFMSEDGARTPEPQSMDTQQPKQQPSQGQQPTGQQPPGH